MKPIDLPVYRAAFSGTIRVPVAARSGLDYSAADCVTSNQGVVQFISNNRNRARNGDSGTRDQGSKSALPRTETEIGQTEVKKPRQWRAFLDRFCKMPKQKLGIRYVLEGSIRKAGNRVRITCQLIDAISGAHLWADHF